LSPSAREKKEDEGEKIKQRKTYKEGKVCGDKRAIENLC
jgi:hypothetical protein